MYVQLTMAERLKDLCVIDKKLTLEQLAEQTGLSKSALGKYENEDCGDINHYAIQKLAKFYGVSTDYLLGLTEQKNHSYYSQSKRCSNVSEYVIMETVMRNEAFSDNRS